MIKIYLGKMASNVGTLADSELLYLTKHTWDCAWYWGFGYVGNSSSHFHFSALLATTKTASELFQSTKISDADWWVIRDLFIQAYALKKAAEVYRYGGHQTNHAGITDIIKDTDIGVRLNADIKKILDVLWGFIEKATEDK